MLNVTRFFAVLFGMGLVFSFAFAISANAQDGTPQLPKKLELIVKHGESIILKIDEFREATLFQSYAEPYTIKVRMDLSENLCADEYVTPRCFYTGDVTFDYLAFIWTKNPNPEKIGKVLKLMVEGLSPDRAEVKSLMNYTYLSQFIGTKPDLRFKADRLSCDQYDWLGSQLSTFQRTNQLHMQLWSGERMTTNLETGTNENRTEQMAENVLFDMESEGLKLSQIGRLSFTSKTRPGIFLVAGSASTLQIQNDRNSDSCQVSFAHNIQAAAAGIDFDAHYKQNPNFKFFANEKSAQFRALQSDFSFLRPDNTANPDFE